jgi:protein-tyrosine phosphatase
MTEHASCMGEFYPRLWVGNLKSVGYLSQLAANDNTNAATTPLTTTPIWTVISILESDILFQWARQRCAVDTSIIHRHVEWKLADSSTAEFLSPKLNSILLEIDAALNGTTVADLCEEKNRFHSSERDGENDCRKCSLDETTVASDLHASLPSQGHCLVHCAQGCSRSVAVCAAWLLTRRKATTVDKALTILRAVRPTAHPNLGFVAGLRALEQCHGDLNAAIERMSMRVHNQSNRA